MAIEAATADLQQEVTWAWQEVRRLRQECDRLHLQATQRPQPVARASALVDKELKRLLLVSHPDRWSAGQSAQELAHAVTTSINALRERLDGGGR